MTLSELIAACIAEAGPARDGGPHDFALEGSSRGWDANLGCINPMAAVAETGGIWSACGPTPEAAVAALLADIRAGRVSNQPR